MLKIAILGYGGRGRIYSLILRFLQKRKAQLVAVIDSNPDKLRLAKKDNRTLDDAHLYSDYRAFLAADKCADWLFVCTQDADHYEHTMAALDKGYDVLLEKPVSASLAECYAIARKAQETGRKVAVCHVLRYSRFYDKVKEVMESGVLGKLVALEMHENVGYWHYAHSYTRGDWRNSDTSTPMIFAKCCHDLDLMVYMLGSNCLSVSSEGRLNYFKRENEPAVCADRCVDCEATDCPYNAVDLYEKRFRKWPFFLKKYAWPMSRIVEDGTPTMPKICEALRNGPFGRCVFRCDNNVVDYQTVSLDFDDGVQATLTMTAFSPAIYRTITVRGTEGTLEGKFEEGKLTLSVFGRRPRIIRTSRTFIGHGGGDIGLIAALVNGRIRTDIFQSIQSHVIAYAAEQSRLKDGERVDLGEFAEKAAVVPETEVAEK